MKHRRAPRHHGAHAGTRTTLGGGCRRVVLQVAPGRDRDRCDCPHYDVCLEAAAKANRRTVCRWPCARAAT